MARYVVGIDDPDIQVDEPKNIRVSAQVYNYLVESGSPGDTLNDVLEKALERRLLNAKKRRRRRGSKKRK